MSLFSHKWPVCPVICRILTLFSLVHISYADTAVNTAPPPLSVPIVNTVNTQFGGNPTPVAQTLVPEGIYAMQLLEALQLTPVTDQAQAEASLSKVGIEPKNGWISDYPVTPSVFTDIDKAITVAIDQGKISISKEQALQRVKDLKVRLGIDVNSISRPSLTARSPNKIYTYTDSTGNKFYTDDYDSIPAQYREQAKVVSQANSPSGYSSSPGAYGPQYTAIPDPNAIYNYYQNQGPPVVTYYPPPQPYYYLYSWAAYPFWSGGYYFPGYFVLNNFHRQIVYQQQPYYVSHHAGPLINANKSFAEPNRSVGSGLFGSASAQVGAAAINNLEHNRNNANTWSNGANPQTGVYSGNNYNPYSNFNNHAGFQNQQHAALANQNTFQSGNYHSFQQHHQQEQLQPAYQANRPVYINQPSFEEHRIVNSEANFGGGGFNGFHNSEHGGFHNESAFRGHEGGGGRGGRR